MRSTFPRGLITLIVSTACFLALVGTYLVVNRSSDVAATANRVGPTEMTGPDRIDAGAGATIVVSTGAPSGTLVQLGVFAPVSTSLLEEVAFDGAATFMISPGLVEHAGLYRFVATVGPSMARHDLRVEPLETVNPVVPFVGPRTIIADGSDFTMVVISPVDQFGNAAPDGTSVDVDVLRPNGEREPSTPVTRGGLAALLLGSTTETGRVTVSSSVGDADGPSSSVDQVAGVPAAFVVQADSRNALADGFTLHAVETSQLRDQFGNVFPDGVKVVFVVQNDSGTSLIQSTVQGGVARAQIEAPEQASEIQVLARVNGVASAPLTMGFEPAVSQIPLTQKATSDRTLIEIGPVLTARGGYVPDGTEVTVTDVSTGELLATSALRGGQISIELALLDMAVEVSILGATAVVSPA